MDDQQQQRVNEAAERFAEALRESYQTVAERGESAQQLNAEMTQQFFNTVINHLQRHADANVQVGEELAGQAQRGQEASRQLTQESVQAYMEFVNSMFSFAQAGTQEAQRGAQRAT
jgi:glycogen debranching enzyme